MYSLFSKVLTASTIEVAETAYWNVINNYNQSVVKYPNWVKYIDTYWKRKEMWCLAFRDYETHGH